MKRLEVEGSVLNVQELIDIYKQIELCRGLRRFFQKLDPAIAPHLQEKISRLSDQKVLEKEILHTISPKGEILDKASPALSEIRHQLKAVREKVQSDSRTPSPPGRMATPPPGAAHHPEKREIRSSRQIEL